VNDGTTTSSPGPTPIALSAIVSASVPFATPTACFAPQYDANSLSKAETSGPRMKRPPSTTEAMAAAMPSRRGASGVVVSNSETGTTAA
jgi:hypothetical protein